MENRRNGNSLFPMGDKNDAFAAYFVGQSYLNMLCTKGVSIGNVTFEPGCRNNWHVHLADEDGGQILLWHRRQGMVSGMGQGG